MYRHRKWIKMGEGRARRRHIGIEERELEDNERDMAIDN